MTHQAQGFQYFYEWFPSQSVICFPGFNVTIAVCENNDHLLGLGLVGQIWLTSLSGLFHTFFFLFLSGKDVKKYGNEEAERVFWKKNMRDYFYPREKMVFGIRIFLLEERTITCTQARWLDPDIQDFMSTFLEDKVLKKTGWYKVTSSSSSAPQISARTQKKIVIFKGNGGVNTRSIKSSSQKSSRFQCRKESPSSYIRHGFLELSSLSGLT